MPATASSRWRRWRARLRSSRSGVGGFKALAGATASVIRRRRRAAREAAVAFFEERRRRLYGFRWRDRLDYSPASPGVAVTPTDQTLGLGNGATAAFQLVKTYGASYAPYQRPIAKPVTGSVLVA